MSDQTVGVTSQAAASGVVLIDVTQLDVDGQTVLRQRVVLADPANAEQFASVTAAGALEVDGSRVIQPISQASPPVGYAGWNAGQVAMNGTTPVPVAAARTGAPGTGRGSITINNTTGVEIWLGPTSALTAANGEPLPIGESITLQTTSAVYAVLAASGTPSLGFHELF